MELYAQDLFFRGNTENEQTYDCCVHGKVIFKKVLIFKIASIGRIAMQVKVIQLKHP